jgi:hypothetical protein
MTNFHFSINSDSAGGGDDPLNLGAGPPSPPLIVKVNFLFNGNVLNIYLLALKLNNKVNVKYICYRTLKVIHSDKCIQLE